MYRIRAIKDTTYIPNLQKANQTQGKDSTMLLVLIFCVMLIIHLSNILMLGLFVQYIDLMLGLQVCSFFIFNMLSLW